MAKRLTFYKGAKGKPSYFLDATGQEHIPVVGDQIDITASDRGWDDECKELGLATQRVPGTDIARIPKKL